MKFSLITPEHSPENIPFLLELYESIREQTYDNWEWIILINGKFTKNHIPLELITDSKVKFIQAKTTSKNIGAIKNEAFNYGTGEVLVECDHDDLLTPDCLEELYKAYQDPDVGFVYSDNAVLHMNGEFIPYDQTYGWTYRTYNWKGQELIAMKSFEPSSHSLGYIWYAPDHVRSWRTSVYKKNWWT